MSRTNVLSIALLTALVSGASATEMERLKAMADNPAAANAGFTNNTRKSADPIVVAANTRPGSKGDFAAPKQITRGQRVHQQAPAQEPGPVKKGIKGLLSTVGSFALLGALIGFCIGLFGAPTLVAGTLSGAIIGGTIGLIFGVAGMLVDFGS